MKHRKLTTILSILFFAFNVFAQCDVVAIPKNDWTIHFVDSEETAGEGSNNGKAIHAIDGVQSTFWHTQWQGAQPGYPHEIQINLNGTHDVVGFSVLSRFDNSSGKPKDYEVYLSADGTNWQTAQSASVLQFPNINAAAQTAEVSFGAVSAQYIRLVFLTAHLDNYYTILSEIDVYESFDCPATGQNNQLATFQTIPKKYTEDEAFELLATTNSALPISFEIVSGPASVNGNVVTLDGTGGQVTVKAFQAGDANFYPWESVQTFDVIDLTDLAPVITTRFLESEEVKMPELSAYLLHAYVAIEESEALSITSVEFEVDGETTAAEFKNNSYQYWWTPTQYGASTIKVIATASNGQVTTETYTLTVSNDIADRTAIAFQDGVIDFGTIGSQWYYGEYEMPQFVGAYNEIIANFSISCPNVPGGCDDWDRLGWVEVKAPSGEWVEIFRYITPYGVPCTDVVDVTDFESILQGKVEYRMYIETWGTGGWKLNLTLDYQAGTPAYKYSVVEELWKGDFSFGDPADLQPVPLKQIFFDDEVEAAKMRLTSTGHGWGSNNSQNAAEFYHAEHHIKVDGVESFQQDLWQTCNPNPANCTGQFGTWQYDRAGWCPGSMGMVFSYDLTEFINQNSIGLDYIFQENYMDYCHPNNPACVSGITCSDCNDGYNPYYRVGAYAIKYSDAPISLSLTENKVKKELEMVLYPNPTKDAFKINVNNQWKNIAVSVLDVSGQTVNVRFFKTEQDLNQATIDLSNVPSGMYFVKIQSEGEFATMRVVKQ